MSEGWLGLAWIFFAPSEMMARGGKSKNLKGENESEKEGLSRLCKGFLSLSLSHSVGSFDAHLLCFHGAYKIFLSL